MLGSLTSQPLSIPLHQMDPSPNNQIQMTNSLSTNPASHTQVKQPEMGHTESKVGMQTPLLPTKRKATSEISVPNKRMVHMGADVNSPRLSHQSGPSNKKMVRNESMSNRTVSPRVQASKNKTALLEVSPKVQNESYEAVRMKMRETLAAALSVNQDKDNVPSEEKSAPQEADSTTGEADAAPGSIVGEANAAPESTVGKADAAPGSTAGTQNLEQTGKNEEEKPQYNYVIPDTDGSFSDTLFVKDELLQGNGLSWAWDMEVSDLKEAQTNEDSNLGHKNASCPQELAVKIEAELFKLFGGVNKKYKEKGRSLMFNLKDRNNPELREKVLSSKISPERLCSMTPEELASKELSEWRMAKAEELDKMIVLPDSDVDMRRLVKKTHKGEYQVEVDQGDGDGVSIEVSVGSSSLTQFQKRMKKDHLSSSGDDGDGVSVEVSVGSSSLTQFQKRTKNDHLSSSGDVVQDKVVNVSSNGTDFMQELNVDEFKDEGFLPPIVSLDEFMESLDSEPPFENLPVDDKELKAQSDKDTSETGGDGHEKTFSGAITNLVEAETFTNNKMNVKTMEALMSVKTSETYAERKVLAPASAPISECLWEGDLQLTISSAVPVIGLFRSGEKTSAKEWPGSMEIKGRVRLEAFEKFLQQLPLSRSRAVMVVHFVLKDASSEYDRASLSEAVDSYIAEERVGFGEPNQGVELYFCPPHKRITEALSKLLSKDQTDTLLQSPENALIGVVVWRRAHPSSTILPNSSSRHKHHREHLSSRRQENLNYNTNFNTKKSDNHDVNGDGDDDDDIPPGFGPGVVARDEDDLPEFSFSKGLNSSGQTLPAQSGSGLGSGTRMPLPQPPVAQMRQLVYEYGQTGNNLSWNGNRGTGIETKPWNQDDDDIPEWNPQLQNRHPSVRPPLGHNSTPIMPIQPPVNIMHNNWMQPPNHGNSWAQPFVPHGLPPNAAVPGQYYGGQWRQDDPRGRGS